MGKPFSLPKPAGIRKYLWWLNGSYGLTYGANLWKIDLMKREQTQASSNRPLFSSRSASLLRATAMRAALVATVFGCTASAIAGDHDKAAATPNKPSVPGMTAAIRIKQWFQTGQASWYGLKFQGHKTATGETYDMNALTCAHPTLPLGSWVRVTNLRNRKTILVRVNDRGPSFGDRIVDLSYAAARALRLGGTGKVKLERVNPKDPDIARILLAQVPDLTAPSLPQLSPGWAPAH
jgi:rare lipoprotein A